MAADHGGIHGVGLQLAPDLPGERAVLEHQLFCHPVQTRRTLGFVADPLHIVQDEHVFKTVAAGRDLGLDLFLCFRGKIGILAVKLQIIHITGGQGQFGKIVPAGSLHTFADLPAELSGQTDLNGFQIFRQKDGKKHTRRGVSARTGDLLPQSSAGAERRQKDHIRQYFQQDTFSGNVGPGRLEQGLPVKQGIVDRTQLIPSLLDLRPGDQLIHQITDDVMRRQNRAERDRTACNHLHSQGEEIVQFETHLFFRRDQIALFLTFRDQSVLLPDLQIGREILIKIVA